MSKNSISMEEQVTNSCTHSHITLKSTRENVLLINGMDSTSDIKNSNSRGGKTSAQQVTTRYKVCETFSQNGT